MVDICAVVEMVLEQYGVRKKHRMKEDDVSTELSSLQTGEKTVVILMDCGVHQIDREWCMGSEILFPSISVSQCSCTQEVVQIGTVNCCCSRCLQQKLTSTSAPIKMSK